MDNKKDKFRGDAFPDLAKAKSAKAITNLVSILRKDDKELYKIAEDEKQSLRTQYINNFKSFHQSNESAVTRGNQNSCVDKHQFDLISAKQSKNRYEDDKKYQLPNSTQSKIYTNKVTNSKKKQTKLPKTRNVNAVRSNKIYRPPSLTGSYFNQGGQGLTTEDVHYVTPITPSNFADKAEENYKAFIRGQAGSRGTAIGDRAVVFSMNGTPHYGDSYLDKSLQENLSANQATSTPSILAVPKNIKFTKPIDSANLNRYTNGQVHPKSDSVGNMLALGGIAAAVTAILFAIQYVVQLVSFVMHIQQLTATVTNIAQSFLGIFNNISALLGLSEDVTKPLEQSIDGLLNNVFGKDKVDYVKLQFAKINTVFTAGVNILNSVRSSSNTLGNAVEVNANNTSKIGNSLKSMGFIDEKVAWFNEEVRVDFDGNTKLAGLNNGLNLVSSVSSDLLSITTDIKSAKEDLDKKDKAYEDKKKQDSETIKKVEKNYIDEQIPETPNISAGDL
jgi:hypothetical protein